MQYTPAKRFAVGLDMQLKLGGLKVSGEYWNGEVKTTDLTTSQISTKFNSYYGECRYEAGIFTPYIRYEHNDNAFSVLYSTFPTNELFEVKGNIDAYTFGIAVRPMYEVLLKLEYRALKPRAEYKNVNIPAELQTAFPPDNPLKIKSDMYNHIVMSLVFSF